MLELTFHTDDEELIRIARAYWAREANGKWTHTVAQLGTLFGRAGIHKLVDKSCTAQSPLIACERCGEPMAIRTRSAFDAYLEQVTQSLRKLRSPSVVRWCNTCIHAHVEEIRRAEDERRAAEEARIETWLKAESSRRQPMAFIDARPTEAFLLYGLLESAGDAWRGNQLVAWDRYKPMLFAHEQDTEAAYRLLYERGWILPQQSDPWTFSVDPAGSVSFRWQSVNWALSPESANAPQAAVLELLDAAIRDAPTHEWVSVWEWVCLSELRWQFDRCHRRAGIRGVGWTSLVEQNFKRLLDRFSLSQLMGVIWNSFKELKWQQDGQRAIANKIPGSFDRLIDNFEAKGYVIKAWWTRKGRENCARYTGLLFDRVLCGGDHFYETLTRAELRALISNGSKVTA